MTIRLRNDHIKDIKRGDIFWYIIEDTIMPVLVAQNDTANLYSENTIIVKMSASERIREKANKIPTIIPVYRSDIELNTKKGSNISEYGYVLTSEIYTIPKKSLKQYIGRLHPEAWTEIESGLQISLGIC